MICWIIWLCFSSPGLSCALALLNLFYTWVQPSQPNRQSRCWKCTFFFFQTTDVLKLHIFLCCSCMSFSCFYSPVKFRHKRWWFGLSTWFHCHKRSWKMSQILSKVTSGCMLTHCVLTRHLKQWSLAWRCQRSNHFVATNMAGNVLKSRQKYPVLMPQKQPFKYREWFHTYRDEMQPGTAVLLLRGKSAHIVKLNWCGRNVWLLR